MVAGTRESTTQQPAHVSSVSPEEEALKRNTDCVYFLASPLTCKKGSECEYRHSEYARVNPRDCWYWLNGSCLNPKCAFRHPPLDGLLGTQSGISSGSSVPMQQSVMPPVAQAPQSSGKQAVPCIFFQKGLCLKGDRCAFLHGANPVGGKAQLAPAATPVKEPSLKKPFGGLEKCSQEPKVQQNFPKFTPVASAPKPTPKAENALLRNGANIEKAAPPPALSSPGIIEEGASRYRSSSTPIINGSSQGRSSRSHLATVPDDYVSSHKDKEADEYLRESSPGFDVLVDDELGDSDYYHSEDQFGRGRAHEGRNLSSVTEYDLDHPGDYSTDINHEIYESHGYEPYERIYGWDQLHESSELMLGGSTQRERKAYPKSKSPGHADDSDLRHRLSKHRRVNGLRSVVSHDFVADDHVERTYHGSSRRDSQQLPSQEGHISSRLKGRIKFPGRPNGNDVQSDREMERGRAPGRSYQSVSRLRDRLKGRAQDEYNTDARNLRAPRLRRESMDEKTADFAGPKSLAELKRKGKGQESSSMGRPLEQPSGGDVSFEGPKPLSVLLKRKRDAGDDGADSGSFVSKEERNREESMEKPEELKTGMHNAAVTIGHGEGACEPIGDATEIDNEDGVTAEDGMEDPELGADEQREDGDYEYEQGEEGDYHYEEAENVEAEEEEYMDDEDGDDFAKKVGVMFS